MEFPPDWKFCTVQPVQMFPYEVGELRARLLTSATCDEGKGVLRIENIRACLRTERLSDFLAGLREKDPRIRIVFF